MRLILFLTISLLIAHTTVCQNLSHKQKAWLYRITQKTPVLYRNWNTHFEFDSKPFQQKSFHGVQIDYDAIEYFQINNPESLMIHWSKIANSSPGLIAEASTLLAIYELNYHLVNTYKKASYTDSIYIQFKTDLGTSLPPKTKEKRKDKILNCVIHPSLPLNKKVEKLSKNCKLELKEQEELLNQWRIVVNKYIDQRSRYFFQQINTSDEFHNMLLLAAGEGSGTAGLLYEKEIHPEDANKLWYGKAIGLFTYNLNLKQGKLKPDEKTRGQISTFNNSAASLHFSMWGLNSSFKPMVVISANKKSYLLFSDIHSMELSPDPKRGEGISYIDRIEQYRNKHLSEAIKELEKENSLHTILDKELAQKETIEFKLERLELDIDSLKKIKPQPEAAITHRENIINSYLSSLTQKEARVKSLQNKISNEYRKIDQARKKVQRMKEVLGENPQKWTENKNEYLFNDGVIFSKLTQDLIFPDSIKPDEIHIDLLSASYSQKGDQRDEVQLLVNSTTPPSFVTEKNSKTPDADTLRSILYFKPDEFQTVISDNFSNLMDSIDISQIILKTAPLRLRADSPKKYADREQELKLPLSKLGLQRFAETEIIIRNKKATITITSSTDPVPTRLSTVHSRLKKELNINEALVRNNNYLSVLRGLFCLNQIVENIEIDQLKIHYPISENEVLLLWNHLRSIK